MALLDKYVALLTAIRAEIPKLWTVTAKNVYAVIRSRYDASSLEIEVKYLAVSKRREDGEFDTAFVPWDEAQRICGERMRQTPEQPRRWVVDTFPDDAEWQALWAARVEP